MYISKDIKIEEREIMKERDIYKKKILIDKSRNHYFDFRHAKIKDCKISSKN